LNKYGICLDPTKKYTILDDVGQQFIDHAAQLVKSGHKFVYVLDNIDWEERVHDMRKDAQNKSVHAVATSIVFSRAPNEKKYSECVGVLDQLEKWTRDIYAAAGLCSSECPSTDAPVPTIGSSSRPDQPASHIPPIRSEDDALHGVKIPCFGDQLTRVRLAGAKDLRAGCHSAKDRLDHLYPFCIVAIYPYWDNSFRIICLIAADLTM
jgi:hypothetical protein